MARLVNMHTAPLDNGHEGPRAARVPPGEVGEFNEHNPSVQLWGRQGLVRSEGEVLASRAASLGNAPTVAELVTLREQLAAREALIDDLQSRLAARDTERARMEDALGKHAQRAADLEAQLAEARQGVRVDVDMTALRAQLSAEMDAHVARVERDLGAQLAEKTEALAARDATIAALQKRVADLEADLATATAPAAGGDTTLDPKAAKPRGR